MEAGLQLLIYATRNCEGGKSSRTTLDVYPGYVTTLPSELVMLEVTLRWWRHSFIHLHSTALRVADVYYNPGHHSFLIVHITFTYGS